MKRIVIFLFISVIVFSACYANTGDIKAFFNTLSFDFVPAEGPLYKETLADPYGFTTKFNYQFALGENRITKLRAAVVEHDGVTNEDKNTYYVDLPILTEKEMKNKKGQYEYLKTGLSVSALRISSNGYGKIPSFKLELGAAGALSTLFDESESLGFDGTYFIGLNGQIADLITFRAGIHHFSGHIGDETLDNYYDLLDLNFDGHKWKFQNKEMLEKYLGDNYNGDENTYYYLGRFIEYVRDNSWLIGIQATPVKGLLVYSEIECPKSKIWLRPFADTVYGYKTPDDKELISKVGEKEKITDSVIEKEIELKQEGFYRAFRIHFGAEYGYTFKNIGTAYASFDVQLHQDGQTKHIPNGYDPKNPWDYEFTADLGWELDNNLFGKKVSLQAEYHDGRPSALNYYYLRIKTFSIGFCVR